MPLSSLITALITPYTEQGSLDLSRLNSLIRWQEESGIEDIVVLGSTGEAFSLTDKERSQLLDSAICAKKRARIWVGCTAFTGEQATLYANEAKQRGAYGIMLAPPPYSKPSQEGILQTVYQVLDNCSLPALLYAIPSRTGVSITPKTFSELIRHPQIKGIKDASGDLSYSTELLHQIASCSSSCRFYCGDDAATLPLLALGAYGTVSVLSNIVPKTFSSLFSFMRQNKNEDALALNRALYPLMKGLFMAPNPTGVKALANFLGLCKNSVRLPHTLASQEIADILVSLHKTLQLSPYFCDSYPIN